jgi:tetratricopeptide (TPR) repeat protein
MEQPMIKDNQGQPVSGATAESVALYDRAVRAYNSGYGDALGLSDEALSLSPGLVMAHLLKSWMFTIANDPVLVDKARGLLRTAEALPMNDRERAHAAALRKATMGARMEAVGLLDLHLMHYPHDLVAHQAAMIMDGFLGRFRFVRDRTARALPRWSGDMPGYGTILAFHGFGCEESGDYARAEEESRAAAELEPYSFWPHHTVSHVMEMTGRPQDGLGWMVAREPFWSTPDNQTQVHIWWHKSLFHLELGQYDAALALYDGPILSSLRPIAINLTNLSALLWRLDLLGVDVGDRWRDLLTLWAGHTDNRTLLFADLHAAMAELRSGQESLAEARLATMRQTATSELEAAPLYRDVGIPLLEGMTAFHRGDYARSVELLRPARFELWRIGGSHAQRDVVDWTLTEAALRANQRDVALALAYERLGSRPRSAVNRNFLTRAERIAA